MVKQSVRKKVSAAKQAATEKKPAAGGTQGSEDGAARPAELDADAAHDEVSTRPASVLRGGPPPPPPTAHRRDGHSRPDVQYA